MSNFKFHIQISEIQRLETTTEGGTITTKLVPDFTQPFYVVKHHYNVNCQNNLVIEDGLPWQDIETSHIANSFFKNTENSSLKNISVHAMKLGQRRCFNIPTDSNAMTTTHENTQYWNQNFHDVIRPWYKSTNEEISLPTKYKWKTDEEDSYYGDFIIPIWGNRPYVLGHGGGRYRKVDDNSLLDGEFKTGSE